MWDPDRAVEESRRLRLLLAAILVAIVVVGSLDLVLDRPDRWLSFHVVFEAAAIAGALVIATSLWWGWWRAERSLELAWKTDAERRAELDAWRAGAENALRGLGSAVNDQFLSWGLTPAEREVALLLIKGHSHKAIGRLTDRSAQTVRQHATSAYRKSGLSGRAELAAFFLQDLMLPDEEPATRIPDGRG